MDREAKDMSTIFEKLKKGWVSSTVAPIKELESVKEYHSDLIETGAISDFLYFLPQKRNPGNLNAEAFFYSKLV